jgi:hypothetical protein
MRHVDRPASGWLVSGRLGLLAARPPAGLFAARSLFPARRLFPAASREPPRAGLLIGLLQRDLFPDRLLFSRGFLIGQVLAGGLTGPRFLIARFLSRRRLIRPLLTVGLVIIRFMTARLRSGGRVVARPGRPAPAAGRPGPRGRGISGRSRCRPSGRFRRYRSWRAHHGPAWLWRRPGRLPRTCGRPRRLARTCQRPRRLPRTRGRPGRLRRT